MADNKYIVGYAKLGTSSCKKCKQKIEKGSLRIGKVTPNPFSDDGGDMKQWFHPSCIFETFVRARATTKKIEDPDDVEGFEDLTPEDKEVIKDLIDKFLAQAGNKASPKPKKTVQTSILNSLSPGKSPTKKSTTPPASDAGPSATHSTPNKVSGSAAVGDDPFAEKDNSFRQFRRLCADIAEENSYIGKTKLVNTYITKGHSGDGFRGDLYLLMKHLLPGVVKSIYNLNNKQLVKLFSQIFGTNLNRMIEDLDQGDVAETIRIFFEESKVLLPQKKSTLSLQEVDNYLDELSRMSKEDEQQRVLTKVAKRCTANDLKMFVRLIKHDLRINAGAKHILDGLDPNAYAAFQASRDLRDVVNRVSKNQAGTSGGDAGEGKPALKKGLSVRASLMTPVLPMLAEACRSVDQAMKKCPNGFYAEIKYDGERVQLHKRGNEFKYFSRSLKPVMEHKVKLDYTTTCLQVKLNCTTTCLQVKLDCTTTCLQVKLDCTTTCLQVKLDCTTTCLQVKLDCTTTCLQVRHFKDYIPKAFPTGNDLILDAEVLLVDNASGNPLPFGTLGVHKKAAFQDATVCLFVFDCLLINDENLMEKPIKERRKILETNMTVVKNRVHLSEIKLIKKPPDLQGLMSRVFAEGLEGLVLKDVNSIYEPGKRHWLKVKKDYLNEGSMADSADLVVLGAYYGTGNKGGMMSIFLMGVHDPATDRWVTVSKCGSGLDDKTLEALNKDLDMRKIGKDFTKVPKWLHINKPLTPDFVVADPKNAPVWEIIGAEFSKAEIHTADGISIRFPRIQKFRDDKSWRDATNLPRLKTLFKKSKEKADLDMKRALAGDDDDDRDGSDENNGFDDDDEAGGDVKQENGQAGTSGTRTSHKTALKREANARNEEGGSPKKKSKADCKYGTSCYQKNPDHIQNFNHSARPGTSSSSSAAAATSKKAAPSSSDSPSISSLSSSLPQTFHGCRILLPPSLDSYRQLKRYILAFDGDVLHPYQAGQATHCIVDEKENSHKGDSDTSESSSSVPRIKPAWLWSCIKQNRLLPMGPFKVS
ncbi:DNA ligase [Plakobranchus ocellatus]|uniref:DNA ligase n=1 Tax=Plakobranchus ocellatus TaxID=259542 RepID=A0AAV4DE35_9GAST|nr:DNA ligase [Plakobranchus ocellatus]